MTLHLTPDEARRLPAVTNGVSKPNRHRTGKLGLSKTIATPVRYGVRLSNGESVMSELDSAEMAELSRREVRERIANYHADRAALANRLNDITKDTCKDLYTPDNWATHYKPQS